MSEEKLTENRLDLATAESTYKIIVALIEQVDASSSLIAVLASALGENAAHQITQTSVWATYLSSKRSLESLKPELEAFVATVTKLVEEQPENNN
jgi:hypothetical protein